MTEQQQWFAGRPEENFGLSLVSGTEAYAGHLGKARELTKRSVDSAIRADSKETGAISLENSALREAAFGNMTDAKQAAAEGLKLVPTSQGVKVEAVLAYVMAGDAAQADSLAHRTTCSRADRQRSMLSATANWKPPDCYVRVAASKLREERSG